jgi:uncharacterized membrane protein
MAAALTLLYVCGDGSVVVFIIIVIVSIFVVVVVILDHPCHLLLRRHHHYVTCRWEKLRTSGRTISTGLGNGEGQYRAATENK